jgi:hypothetical protein
LKVAAHYFVEGSGQAMACRSPPADLGQAKRRCAPEFGRVEVLVSDGVSPIIQHLKYGSPGGVPGIVTVHFGPKIDSEPAEVGAKAAGLCVAPVQLAASDELRLHKEA